MRCLVNGSQHCRFLGFRAPRLMSSLVGACLTSQLFMAATPGHHSQSRSVDQPVLVSSPIWRPRPDFCYCQTVKGLSIWGALSDERTGLSFTIASCPHQRSHSRVRVPPDSWAYFTVSDTWLFQPGGSGSRIYFLHEQGGPAMDVSFGSIILPFRHHVTIYLVVLVTDIHLHHSVHSFLSWAVCCRKFLKTLLVFAPQHIWSKQRYFLRPLERP
jgi:hypothetical protein